MLLASLLSVSTHYKIRGGILMTVSYAHEPFTNFQEETNKQSFQEALAYVNSQLGKHYPLIINGEAIETDKKIISVNPADKKK